MNLGTFLWNISGIRAPKSYDTTPLLLELPFSSSSSSSSRSSSSSFVIRSRRFNGMGVSVIGVTASIISLDIANIICWFIWGGDSTFFISNNPIDFHTSISIFWLGTVRKYFKFFSFSLLRKISRTPPSPSCFSQVKPQVSYNPLPPSIFHKLFLRFKFEKKDKF